MSNLKRPGVTRYFAGKADNEQSSEEEDEEVSQEEEQEEDLLNNEEQLNEEEKKGQEDEYNHNTTELDRPKITIKPITSKPKSVPPSEALKPVEHLQPAVSSKTFTTTTTTDIKTQSDIPSDSSSSEEESSSEESSSSEDDGPVLVKPKFISKTQRTVTKTEPAKVEEDPEVRKAHTLALAESTIQHQLTIEAMFSGEPDPEVLMVDDTDDIDPEAEFTAWKIRELTRVKRDREQIVTRERELEELQELRESKTEAEREAEALDRKLEQDRAIQEQKEKGEQGKYTQRYYHKGAFFQDDELVKNRDFSQALEDDYRDKKSVPKALQVRRQDEIGKQGRTKYKSLKEEDTSRGGLWDLEPKSKNREH